MPANSTATQLEAIINQAWETRESITPASKGKGEVADAVAHALDGLDKGVFRVASPKPAATGKTEWLVHAWLKKAVLLSFRLHDLALIPSGSTYPSNQQAAQEASWWDKVPSKFAGWDSKQFTKAGFRAVPGAIVRHSAYIAPKTVLMPSFVNLGAYVDEGTMVDTWATVGSCAQIGKNVHLSGGVGIGGVLEPPQAQPVIIEDDCFIGARSEVVEGVIIRQGAVLAMGVFISATTRIIDRHSGEVHIGEVPPYAVVVPGSIAGKPMANDEMGPNLACAVIIKQVDARTRSKTAINELLRD
ncbi:MAG: 2,3,4,5-tetrahydropyridine-2,6-dicarboxylate N-succinyltransferase [Proteobacteria bacterium]|nr:2,3,4,5-tetrahydropyridine-2,6-dicarboxylate N-succinyltransferase [Pseudomonadota bacterium]